MILHEEEQGVGGHADPEQGIGQDAGWSLGATSVDSEKARGSRASASAQINAPSRLRQRVAKWRFSGASHASERLAGFLPSAHRL